MVVGGSPPVRVGRCQALILKFSVTLLVTKNLIIISSRGGARSNMLLRILYSAPIEPLLE